MKKASEPLPRELEEELALLMAKGDDEIDLSDMPEVRDWSGAVRGRFFRPVKQQVTLRLDADLLQWFRDHGGSQRGYQTRINAALRRFVENEERKAG